MSWFESDAEKESDRLSRAFQVAIEQSKLEDDPNDKFRIDNINNTAKYYKASLANLTTNNTISLVAYEQKKDEIDQTIKDTELGKWSEKAYQPYKDALEAARTADPQHHQAALDDLDAKKTAYTTYLNRIHNEKYINDDQFNQAWTNIKADLDSLNKVAAAPDPDKQQTVDTNTPAPKVTTPQVITGEHEQNVHIQELLATLGYKDNLGYIQDKIKSGSPTVKDFDGIIKQHTNADIQAFETKYNADHKGHELPTYGSLTSDQLIKALEETFKANNPGKDAHVEAEALLADARKEGHDHPTHPTGKPSAARHATPDGTTPAPPKSGNQPLAFDAPHTGDDALILALRKDWGENQYLHTLNSWQSAYNAAEKQLIEKFSKDHNAEIVDGKPMTLDDALKVIRAQVTPGGNGTGPGYHPAGTQTVQQAR